jgi:DNA mismatch repair protein MutS
MESTTIHQEYLSIESQIRRKYGQQTVLFYQVGSFFELYADSPTHMTDICQICNLNISEKKSKTYMAGFRDYTLEKYIEKATQHGYTVVVYLQRPKGRDFERFLEGVYSPGTFISCDPPDSSSKDESPSNTLCCIWLDCAKRPTERLICGFTLWNLYTGESFLYEFDTSMNILNMDELEQILTIYSPSEVIWISTMPGGCEEIRARLANSHKKNHVIDLTQSSSEETVLAQRATQQKYIVHLLEQVYQRVGIYEQMQELQTYTVATQSLCYLLHFLQEHHPSLVQQVVPPQWGTQTHRLLLANQTLRQLNIIHDANAASTTGESTHTKSLAHFLNRCVTSGGRRKLVYELTHPITDPLRLQQEYDRINHFMGDMDMIESLRKIMRTIRDFDVFSRQIVSERIVPDTMILLYDSLETLHSWSICLETQPPSMWSQSGADEFQKPLLSWIHRISSCFDISALRQRQRKSAATSYESRIFQPAYDANLATLWRQFDAVQDNVAAWVSAFERWLPPEHVKLHETEKQGITFQITKTRAKNLKAVIQKALEDDYQTHLLFPAESRPAVFLRDVRVGGSGGAGGGIEEITFSELQDAVKQIQRLKTEIADATRRRFREYVTTIKPYCSELATFSRVLATWDLWFTKAKIARENKYVCPTVVGAADPSSGGHASYVALKGVRHALIEHIQTRQTYVANDVSLGGPGSENEPRGLVVYGCNTCGKTSLLRAVGMAVLMAQAGWFVPAESMEYTPFHCILSRISSNDNLFKNLSSFAVEMVDLSAILKMANERCLVLADELCHSTELESALTLVATTLNHLCKQQTCFFVTSHFHDLPRLPVIHDQVKMGCIRFQHLHVFYNDKTKQWVFERKLRPGTGSRYYGLEIARWLQLPEAFMKECFDLRDEWFGITGALGHETSRYNSKKVVGMCESCGCVLAEETHHVLQQKYADEVGFVGGVHKNAVANLMALCGPCHKKVHHH